MFPTFLRPSGAIARSLGVFAAVLTAGVPVAPACSVCGCSLSADWAAQGFEALPGFDTSLRYEYFDQTVLRSGTGAINRAAVSFPADDEIQQETRNRNTWFELNYAANSRWSVTAQVPWHDRYHTTIAAGDTGVSNSSANGIGDARIIGRYQQPGFKQSYGLQFGLKLPTGRFDQNFAAGPQAGTPLDRGLQLGTGTTDFLLGASWFARPMVNLGCFVQATLDQPLAARDGFIPSTSINVSGGLRWLNSSSFTPQVQFNVRGDSREHGANADTRNSGGVLAYVSPGVTAELGDNARAFIFVQLPVYQRVNGLQLEPRSIISVGVRLRL